MPGGCHCSHVVRAYDSKSLRKSSYTVKGCEVNLRLLQRIWNQKKKMHREMRNPQEICRGAQEGRQGGPGNKMGDTDGASPRHRTTVLILDIVSPFTDL